MLITSSHLLHFFAFFFTYQHIVRLRYLKYCRRYNVNYKIMKKNNNMSMYLSKSKIGKRLKKLVLDKSIKTSLRETKLSKKI